MDINNWILIYLFALGAALGSFINVLAARVPKGESINGRSHCDYCARQLRFFDLIPILSYIFLKGRCRYCHHQLSLIYPLVESVTAILFLIFGLQYVGRFGWEALVTFTAVVIVMAITVADFHYQMIPDEFLVFLLLLGILLHYQLLPQYFGASAAGAFIIWLLHFFSHGQAMGFADVKFVWVMGWWLNLPQLLFALYIAFVVGGVLATILLLRRQKTLKSTIAFGPFLTVGFLTSLWFAN